MTGESGKTCMVLGEKFDGDLRRWSKTPSKKIPLNSTLTELFHELSLAVFYLSRRITHCTVNGRVRRQYVHVGVHNFDINSDEKNECVQ